MLNRQNKTDNKDTLVKINVEMFITSRCVVKLFNGDLFQ
jgi:hypothetical protein